MMQPYWISLDNRLGVGITARSEADALEIFTKAFGSSEAPVNIEVIRDINDLDLKHVVPNMGNWLRRGVWFPLGYDDISN